MEISRSRFNNSSRSNTSRTNPSPYGAATSGNHMNFFQVWQPAPPSFIISMGNIIPCNRPFSTNFTYFSHHSLLPLLLSPLFLYQQARATRLLKYLECMKQIPTNRKPNFIPLVHSNSKFFSLKYPSRMAIKTLVPLLRVPFDSNHSSKNVYCSFFIKHDVFFNIKKVFFLIYSFMKFVYIKNVISGFSH
jgi:hypothetical protein